MADGLFGGMQGGGLLGGISDQDKMLALLSVGGGLLGGSYNQGGRFGPALAQGINQGIGTLGTLSQMQALQQLREAQGSKLKLEEEEAKRKAAVIANRQATTGRIGQPVSLAPTVENAANPQIFGHQQAIDELLRSGDIEGARGLKDFAPPEPKYSTQRNERGELVYVPETPGRGEVRPVGVTLYNPELDPNVRGAKIEDRVKIEQLLDPLLLNRARAGSTKFSVENKNFPARQDFKDEQALRKEYTDESASFKKLTEGYQKVRGALAADPTKSAPATLAAATQFMKLLDPESVVRESELQMALQSTGMLDRFMNLHNQVMSGKVLTPNQAAEVGKIADVMYQAGAVGQGRRFETYRNMAKDYGFSGERAVPDIRLPAENKSAQNPTKTVGGKTYVKINGQWFEQ